MPDWFLLTEDKPLSAAENMARDELMFRRAHDRECGFFRLYEWKKPSFSFGVSQRIEKAVNREFVVSHDCEYVRRVTGGKTVLHNDELTYSVVSSETIFYRDHDLFKSYLLIARVLLEALRRIGVPAELSNPKSDSQLARSSNPCFSFPTPNEIEARGRKILGSAQKRDNQALLQHGSIPYRIDYALYGAGANFRAELLERSMTCVSAECSSSKEELKGSLVSAMRDFVERDFLPLGADFFSGPVYEELLEKYRSESWNERAEFPAAGERQ